MKYPKIKIINHFKLQNKLMFIVFFLRNFKQTLIELERTYSILIDVEDCEKKLTALPTGTSMRLKVNDKRIFMQPMS